VSRVVVLVTAMLIDAAFGDPPGKLHPVSWIGSAYAKGKGRLLRPAKPWHLLVAGAALTVAVAGLAAALGALLEWLVRDAGAVGVVVEALALKMTLSLRGLARAGYEVRRALDGEDLAGARHTVGVHLVSRPVANLDAAGVASAAIESVAENLTDAVIAPLCFFLVLGLPGAVAYRAINTADAMIGYRHGALEHFGKIAARLDDVLNLLPARIAALALVAAVALAGHDVRGAVTTMWRDHSRTASPNAGWTMAAMAGGLGVVLEKRGAYRLGRGRLPGPADITSAVRIMVLGAAVVIVAIIAVKSIS